MILIHFRSIQAIFKYLVLNCFDLNLASDSDVQATLSRESAIRVSSVSSFSAYNFAMIG